MGLCGLELIKKYRNNPERYLPMLDFTVQIPAKGEDGGYNIGWYAGLLDEKRPFFAECWAIDHITMLTIYVSTKGIESITPGELDRWFQDIGYYKQKGKDNTPTVRKLKNPQGNEFFAVDICVGVDKEPAKIDGGSVWGWHLLNEYKKMHSTDI